jgi:hypothetical protein
VEPAQPEREEREPRVTKVMRIVFMFCLIVRSIIVIGNAHVM